MGAFFTNVQMLAGDRDPARVRAALLAKMGAEWIEAAAGEAAERTVLIGPTDGGWIAVYDQATEGQDVASLDALAAALSGALETSAVSVLVHDSDVLLLALHQRGRLVDRFDSHPGSAAPALDSVRAIATVTPLDRALRIDLRNPADLDALERALAPLLPDSAAWRAGIDRLHGRTR